MIHTNDTVLNTGIILNANVNANKQAKSRQNSTLSSGAVGVINTEEREAGTIGERRWHLIEPSKY